MSTARVKRGISAGLLDGSISHTDMPRRFKVNGDRRNRVKSNVSLKVHLGELICSNSVFNQVFGLQLLAIRIP